MRTFVLSIVAACGLASSAHAGIASAIFAQAGPKSLAPGLGGLTFTSFDRPYRSLNGNWIITATVNTGATTTDEVVYTGVGTIGTFRAQEGTTVIVNGRTIDSASIDTKVAINDNGDFAFTANLSGATTDDESIVYGTSGGLFSVPYREGQNIGTLPTFTGDVSIGTSVDSPSLTNAGGVSFRAFSITGGGAGTGNNTIGVRNNVASLDFRYQTTEPSNLPGRTYQAVLAGDYYVDATGNNWFALADLTGATADDGVIIVNNVAVIQEGVTTIGGGPVSTYGEAGMDASGRWFVRGSNSVASGGNDWVVAGDTTGAYSVVALTDTPITPGSTELWDDATFASTFFLFAQNNSGDYVVGGTTNNADLAANAVLVYNGVFELIREGDAIDLDGNGVLDDGAFVSVFNNDDAFLDGDQFYFTANIVDVSGAALGQAFLTMTVPTPGALALLGMGGLLAARRRR